MASETAFGSQPMRPRARRSQTPLRESPGALSRLAAALRPPKLDGAIDDPTLLSELEKAPEER